MRAAAWSVVHRKDDGVYFSHVDTIREVLEDRQCSSADTSGRCVQYQGYWRGDPLPEVERKWGPRPESGDPGDPGRARWFEALDIACRVLTNCAEDKTKGYLWWGNGESAELRMRAKEAEDPEGFDYFGSLGFRGEGPHIGVLQSGKPAIALKVKVQTLE